LKKNGVKATVKQRKRAKGVQSFSLARRSENTIAAHEGGSGVQHLSHHQINVGGGKWWGRDGFARPGQKPGTLKNKKKKVGDKHAKSEKKEWKKRRT